MKLKKLLLSIFFTANVLLVQNAYASAPNITLKFADTTQHLSDFKGKLVYLDFWASWCIPCRKSFSWMNKMHEKYKSKGLEIIAINLDKDSKLVSQFLKKYPVLFKVAYDSSGNTAEQFHVKGMPTSFLISREGELISVHMGFRKKDMAKLENFIQSNL